MKQQIKEILQSQESNVERLHGPSTGSVGLDVPLPREHLVKGRVKSPTSHHGYALKTLDHLTVDGWKPVFYQGDMYILEQDSNLWVPYERQSLLRLVAELNDARTNCQKYADYTGITEQACAIASDSEFFSRAAVGTACQGCFYKVDRQSLIEEVLLPEHRQRVMLDFKPLPKDTPEFTRFLMETFRSEVVGEQDQQIRIVQEIAGAILLGVLPRFHKAVLFYDPYGRAGKGTLERIFRALVPSEFTSAVSPFKWHQEYYLASLIGSRLNVVGELPADESIPAANLKTVLGGDLIAGRQPSRSVVMFSNEAAHLFTSNHLITTRDHSAAFYGRWLLVEFPNSLLRSGQTPDVGLLERILPKELPGIAYWALQGGLRLLSQGRFSSSAVHDRLVEKWRRTGSSVDEFIHECCELKEDGVERRAAFYGTYKRWCNDNGRKPMSKGNVKELMEHSVGLPVRFTTLDGYDVVRGIAVREDYRDEQMSI